MTWTLLDSLVNVDANGNELPEAQRDHQFVGDTTYQIVVDPTPEINGDIHRLRRPRRADRRALPEPRLGQHLEAALRRHRDRASSSTCTSIILDPNSKSPTTGNLDILYAAFPAIGVYVAPTRARRCN